MFSRRFALLININEYALPESILTIRCDDWNNIKEQFNCISVVVLSKKNGRVNRLESNVKDIIRIRIVY